MAAFPLATALPGALRAGADEFTSDLVAARLTVANLARWARRHVLAGEGGVSCACSGACRLSDVPAGGHACRLARELAWLPSADELPSGGHERPGWREDVAARYVQALRGSADAIAYCQRIQHVLGECWFTTPERAGEDLCARTLAASELLSSARRLL